MPAARMGWIVIHDRNNQFDEIRRGLINIAGRNFWPNSTLSKALPAILKNVPQNFFNDNSKKILVRSKLVWSISFSILIFKKVFSYRVTHWQHMKY